MKNLKRFLAMALTMLMIAGSVVGASAAMPFTDVTDYAEAIEVLSSVGIIAGKTDKEFAPEDDVTRWQMSLLVTKMVTGKIDIKNWETENYSTFTDIKPNHYCGSISWAAGENIVKGESTKTFNPEGNILYKDAITMVVRAMGYTDLAYPQGYINKGAKLGLDRGIEGVGYEDTLNRGETAQILYNAFVAKFATEVFNITAGTVVITGSNTLNMLDKDPAVVKNAGYDPKGDLYVTFSVLNTDEHGCMDGTFGKSYSLPCTAFGLKNEDVYAAIGSSYAVLTGDDCKTFLICNPCDSETLAQDKFVSDPAVAPVYVTIDGQQYKVVDKITDLNNTQGVRQTYPEIIVYGVNTPQTIGGTKTPMVNATGDFVAADGKTVALKANKIGNTNIIDYYTYTPVATGASYKIDVYNADGTLKDLTAYGVGYTNLFSNVQGAFKKLTAAEIKAGNAYADVALYDDNGDGYYDRAMYSNYSFGQYSEAPGTTNVSVGDTATGVAKAGVTFTGEAIKAGDFALYTWNAQSKVLYIKEILPLVTGKVGTMDFVAKKIAIDAKTLNYGNATLPGAEVMTQGSVDNWGKFVKYIEKDGNVLKVLNSSVGGLYVYLPQESSSIVNYTTNGVIAKLYASNSNLATYGTIATINNISYPYGLANGRLNEGLYSAMVDQSGYYHLTTIEPTAGYTYYNAHSAVGTMEFNNSIANYTGSLYTTTYQNTTKTFGRFQTNADTIYVVVNALGAVQVAKGIPANGAQIKVEQSAEIMVQMNPANASIAQYIYVSNGSFEKGFVSSLNNTIVLYDANSYRGTVSTNVNGGTSNAYNNALFDVFNVINMKTGALETYKVNATVAPLLVAGGFYNVENGVITSRATLNSGNDVKVGRLVSFDGYNMVISGETPYDNQFVKMFSFTDATATNVTDTNTAAANYAPLAYAFPAGTFKADGKTVAEDKYITVTYYSGASDAAGRVAIINAVNPAIALATVNPATITPDDFKTLTDNKANVAAFPLTAEQTGLLKWAIDFRVIATKTVNGVANTPVVLNFFNHYTTVAPTYEFQVETIGANNYLVLINNDTSANAALTITSGNFFNTGKSLTYGLTFNSYLNTPVTLAAQATPAPITYTITSQITSMQNDVVGSPLIDNKVIVGVASAAGSQNLPDGTDLTVVLYYATDLRGTYLPLVTSVASNAKYNALTGEVTFNNVGGVQDFKDGYYKVKLTGANVTDATNLDMVNGLEFRNNTSIKTTLFVDTTVSTLADLTAKPGKLTFTDTTVLGTIVPGSLKYNGNVTTVGGNVAAGGVLTVTGTNLLVGNYEFAIANINNLIPATVYTFTLTEENVAAIIKNAITDLDAIDFTVAAAGANLTLTAINNVAIFDDATTTTAVTVGGVPVTGATFENSNLKFTIPVKALLENGTTLANTITATITSTALGVTATETVTFNNASVSDVIYEIGDLEVFRKEIAMVKLANTANLRADVQSYQGTFSNTIITGTPTALTSSISSSTSVHNAFGGITKNSLRIIINSGSLRISAMSVYTTYSATPTPVTFDFTMTNAGYAYAMTGIVVNMTAANNYN